MYYAGHCKDRDRQKWRCPNTATKSDSTDCKCSTSDYERVVYTHTPQNLRVFPKTPRSSPTFKKSYDHRTAAERVFKRQKLDFKLEQFRTRSKGRPLFYALLTAIAIHVETWWQLDTEAISGYQPVEKETKLRTTPNRGTLSKFQTTALYSYTHSV